MTIENPMQLNGRTILVTGASSGIGRSIAQLCDRLGANVVLVGRSEERLQQTLETLSKRDHIIEVVDLTQTSGIPEWLRLLTEKIGSLYGLVHSAGIYQLKPLQFMSEKNWNDVMTPNLEAAVQLAKGFRQKGVHEPKSSIVFVSSVMGLVGQPGTAAYAASKGALIAMSKSLALELAHEGIRVNCVAPGQVLTEMTERQRTKLTDEQFEAIEKMHPLGIGEAIDVANAVAFLLAETARWITGTTLVVDGGYTAH